ncbi:hypothetical protein ACNS7O_14695 (plasmid) [Haloferacaceae archaeon DSL9]
MIEAFDSDAAAFIRSADLLEDSRSDEPLALAVVGTYARHRLPNSRREGRCAIDKP